MLAYVLMVIACMNTSQSVSLNQWEKRVGIKGEDIWASTSAFIPQPSASFGSIKLGKEMSAEFDFIWHGRASNANPNEFENFFRVGFDGEISPGCDGSGARYPSFWLTPAQEGNYMHVSVSNDKICQPAPQLEYAEIEIGVSYHVRIRFNESRLVVDVGLTDRHPISFPEYSNAWERDGTQPQYLGMDAPVWFMSNTYSPIISSYVCGNATFSNITLTSYLFDPTESPTSRSPTATPTDVVQYPTLVALPVTKTPTRSPLNEAVVTDAPTAMTAITAYTTSSADDGDGKNDASNALLLGMDVTAVIGICVAAVVVLCVCIAVCIVVCIKKRRKTTIHSAHQPISTMEKGKHWQQDATTYTAVIMDGDENESPYIDADGEARRLAPGEKQAVRDSGDEDDDSSLVDEDDDQPLSPVPYGEFLSVAQKRAFRKMKSATPGGPGHEGSENPNIQQMQ